MGDLGLKKSFLLLFLFYLGIAFILNYENVSVEHIISLVVFPLALVVMILLLLGFKDDIFFGFFFLLIGFVAATSLRVPILIKLLVIFGVPVVWFLLYLDLKEMDWIGSLVYKILHLNWKKRLLLLIADSAFILTITLELLKCSSMSITVKIFILLACVVVFVIFAKISQEYKDVKTKKDILRVSAWPYVFIYVIVKTGFDAICMLLQIIAPLAWVVLLALIGFSKSARYQGKEDEPVAFPAHDTQRITEKTQPNMPAEGD